MKLGQGCSPLDLSLVGIRGCPDLSGQIAGEKPVETVRESLCHVKLGVRSPRSQVGISIRLNASGHLAQSQRTDQLRNQISDPAARQKAVLGDESNLLVG